MVGDGVYLTVGQLNPVREREREREADLKFWRMTRLDEYMTRGREIFFFFIPGTSRPRENIDVGDDDSHEFWNRRCQWDVKIQSFAWRTATTTVFFFFSRALELHGTYVDSLWNRQSLRRSCSSSENINEEHAFKTKKKELIAGLTNLATRRAPAVMSDNSPTSRFEFW